MAKNDSLSQLAYEAIYSRLLARSIPPGQRVSENGIARQLGMSRTPVREAIRRLTREGMLYQVPRSGTYVSQPDRKRIVEAYEMRIYLESLAAAKAARAMSASEIGQLGEAVGQMRDAGREFRESGARVISGDMLQKFASGDMQFHLLILRAADNRMLFRTVAEILMQKQTLTFRGPEHDLRLLARVWLFHARIARAVRRRDASAARHWMRAHLRDSRRNALAAFDRQLGSHGDAVAPADLTGVVERLIQRVGQGGDGDAHSATDLPAMRQTGGRKWRRDNP